jgi:large subunit ribosomal protein L1
LRALARNTLLEFQKGKIEFKSDKYGNIHLLFGKLNFEDNKLEENLYSIYA